MKKILCVILLFSLKAFLVAQGSVPQLRSVDYLRTKQVNGSERERHYSMRTLSLGLDFQGLIEDQVSDLYRNPAYFNLNKEQLLWGEIVQGSLANYTPRVVYKSSPIYISSSYYPEEMSDEGDGEGFTKTSSPSSFQTIFAPLPTTTTNSNGLRFGYANSFGLMIRGNRSNSETQNNYDLQNGDINGIRKDQRTSYRKSVNTWADIQLSHGLTLSEDVSFGMSYSLVYDEKPINEEQQLWAERTYHYSTSRESTWIVQPTLFNSGSKLVSHIIRAGMIFEGEHKVFEAVSTLELQSSDYSINYSREYSNQSERSYSYYYPEINFDNRQNSTRQFDNFSANSAILRVDLRYFNKVNEQRTFAAQFGVSASFFSAEETGFGSDFNREYRKRIYDTVYVRTHEETAHSEFLHNATPDGFGISMNGNVGWGFNLKDWYLLIGASGSITQHSFDYDDVVYTHEILTLLDEDTVSRTSEYENKTAFHHKNTMATVRLALPVAFEYEIVDDFSLRAGWALTYIRGVDKDRTISTGYRKVNENISTGKVTVGVGCVIVEGLRADFLSLGNLTDSKQWNLSVIYSL